MPDVEAFPNYLAFDWSGGNAEKIWIWHKVTITEAEEVFFNQPLLVGDDTGHSRLELRQFALGITNEGREMFLAFTLRDGLIRVISARDMSRKERKIYGAL